MKLIAYRMYRLAVYNFYFSHSNFIISIIIYSLNRKKDLGGGTVLDLGVYVIQCCQWAFQQAPKSITATGILNDDGVDVEMTAEINYGENKFGKIKTSAVNSLSNKATITGTKGQITVLHLIKTTKKQLIYCSYFLCCLDPNILVSNNDH